MQINTDRYFVMTLLPDSEPATIIDIENKGVSTIEILDAISSVRQKLMDDVMNEYLKDRGLTDISQVDATDYDEYINFLRKNKIG